MEAQKEPEDESKLSDSALIKSINNGVFVIDQRIDDLEDKLVELENKLQKIFWFIEFHLGKIPQKYKKIFPENGEYPYFGEAGNFCKDKNIPEFNETSELDIPEDTEALKASKERMLKLAEKGWPERPTIQEISNKLAYERVLKKKAEMEAMLKQASLEAFPTSSASPDSCQVDKPIESSPSSQESPDHKNPPSQT